jgi:hypothetical protein
MLGKGFVAKEGIDRSDRLNRASSPESPSSVFSEIPTLSEAEGEGPIVPKRKHRFTPSESSPY